MKRKKGCYFYVLFFRVYYSIVAFVKRKYIILNNVDRYANSHRVNLNYWDSAIEIEGNVNHNLGDNLSEIVTTYFLGEKGLSFDKEITSNYKHLYAIGSIISMGFQNATIWGSGFLEDLTGIRKIMHSSCLRHLDVRSVRGPRTRDLLLKMGHNCPEVYGDPALLMPLITPDLSLTKVQPTVDFIIIPHFTKEAYYRERYGADKIVSMITDDYRGVISRILRAKKVISSSLHGIILSEAYGVPCIFLRDRESNKDFKYEDYYLSTNRSQWKYATTVEEGIAIEPMPLPINIKELQEGLLKSFPYDLWNN